MDNILNEAEKLALKKFVSSQTTVDAVKKVLLNDIYGNGVIEANKPPEPRKNWVYGLMMNEAGQDFKISNEELGEKVRAIVEGTRALELAFKEMDKFKQESKSEASEINEAR